MPGAAGKLRVTLYFFSLSGPGGAERMLLWLAARLSERGYDVSIATLDDDMAEPFHPIPANIRWLRLGRQSGVFGKLRRVRRLRRFLRDSQVDVFVGFVMGADKTIYAATAGLPLRLIAAERNDPVIYHQRLSRLGRLPYWLLFRRCNRIAVQLPEYRSGYPAFLRDRITVVPNPVAAASLHSGSGDAGEGGLIVSVGRLHHQKGQDLLLPAFARIAERFPNWQLRLVGDGPERSALETQANRLGIGSRVQFAGAVTDVSGELQRAELFAFPSRYEGFPNALAEAMACGLPCVAFAACTGAASLLDQGRCGELVQESESPEALAHSLTTLIENSDKRDELGSLARKAVQRYREDVVLQAWERLLRGQPADAPHGDARS